MLHIEVGCMYLSNKTAWTHTIQWHNITGYSKDEIDIILRYLVCDLTKWRIVLQNTHFYTSMYLFQYTLFLSILCRLTSIVDMSYSLLLLIWHSPSLGRTIPASLASRAKWLLSSLAKTSKWEASGLHPILSWMRKRERICYSDVFLMNMFV